MANDDLRKPLKAINKTISRLREDVQRLTGEVEKIRTVIKEAAESIRDAIQESIQAQAELKLMEHVMEVRSVKPQIEAEHEQLRSERSELEERLNRIGERYERKQSELNEKARERVRDLGSHIFEIDEEQFEAGIEEPFTELVTATWHLLHAHNENVREERSTQIRDTTDEVVRTVRDFVDRQETLVESIQRHRLDPDEVSLPADRAERLQVPYYVVQYEVDGIVERQTVVPSRLTTGTEADWCAVSLSPIRGVERFVADVSGVDDPGRTESVSESDLLGVLEEYGESSPLGVSYSDAVADATPEDGRVPVHVAGGES